MTQAFAEDGERIGVTVIEAGPCPVLQVKTAESDGYAAIQIGFGDARAERFTRPMLGHFRKSGSKPKKFVREIRDPEGDYKVGSMVTVSAFEGVRKVDVTGVSKGKGYAGGVKRWHMMGQPASHGAKKVGRELGGTGRTYSVLGKGIPKGKHMAGHMGAAQRTSVALPLFRIDAEKNLILVRGSVPGGNGTFVIVKKSKREKPAKDKK